MDFEVGSLLGRADCELQYCSDISSLLDLVSQN